MTTTLVESSGERADGGAASSTIGARIAAALATTGMTQVELARQLVGASAEESRVESTRRLLNKWIRDLHAPGPLYAQRLAAIFRTEPDYFTASPSIGATTDADHDEEVATDALEFVFDFASATPVLDDPDQLPERLSPNDIAGLAPHFVREHILLTEVEKWEPGKSATAVAKLSLDVWNLREWYSDSPIIPAVLILEALAQTASVALLTEPRYRGRIVLCAGYNRTRIKRAVKSGDTLRLVATLHGHEHSQVAHFDTTAFSEAGDVVARGVLTLAVH